MTAGQQARITETTMPGATVFVASGPLDRDHAELVKDRIDALTTSGARRFIVDLSSVDWIERGAVGPLLEAARSSRRVDGRVSVVFDPLLAIFTIDGIEAFFDVAVTQDDALTRISRPSPSGITRGSAGAPAQARPAVDGR